MDKRKSNKKINKGKKVSTMAQRLRMMLIVFFMLFVMLIGRLAWLQGVKGASLKEAMYNQLITDRIISAKRGTIYDTNGKALARSAQVDTVTISPRSIKVEDKDEEVEKIKTKELKEKLSKAFADIFELDYEETLKKVSSNNRIETIARKVEKDKIDKLKAWMKENKVYSGINIDADAKRYYPYDNLASTLVGFCGVDNQGLAGLEANWDDVLKGVPGKMTTSQDAVRDLIPDQNQTYVAAKNGNDLKLTIDVNIQAIAEKYLKQACEDNKCKNGGNVIIMNPNNGDILAMATYPDYNLNTPFTPTNISEKEWNKKNGTEQYNILQNLWSNRAISSRYEPGSVYKIITAAAGLEENIVEPDTPNVFSCKGYEKISGIKLYCSNTAGHGKLSLRGALKYSCNPAFMQLGKKIGASTLYRYYDAFGFFDKTNFASIGEASGYYWNLENVGPIELATMSFGQRFGITPIQMITAVSAIANDGILMQPRIVKEITNTDTSAITTIEPKAVRQVVSKETANQLLDMLESVVDDGTGKYAQVKGYTIAGKTGTSEPDPAKKSEGYVASFAAISPVESPEVVVLVTLYGLSEQRNHQGSIVAGPVVSQILSEVLPYLEIPSDTTVTTTNSKTKTLPNVENKTVAEARKIIEKAGFTCKLAGDEDELVAEQMPKAGTSLLPDATVIIYTQGNDTRISQTVPQLKGMTASQAKKALKNKNLNIKITGTGKVTSQDPISGTSVEEGTVIRVVLQNEIKE